MYPLAPFRVIKVYIFHSLIAALPAYEWVFFDSTVSCPNNIHLIVHRGFLRLLMVLGRKKSKTIGLSPVES